MAVYPRIKDFVTGAWNLIVQVHARPARKPVSLSDDGLMFQAYMRDRYGLSRVWLENGRKEEENDVDNDRHTAEN
jgi:hypothetical protein